MDEFTRTFIGLTIIFTVELLYIAYCYRDTLQVQSSRAKEWLDNYTASTASQSPVVAPLDLYHHISLMKTSKPSKACEIYQPYGSLTEFYKWVDVYNWIDWEIFFAVTLFSIIIFGIFYFLRVNKSFRRP